MLILGLTGFEAVAVVVAGIVAGNVAEPLPLRLILGLNFFWDVTDVAGSADMV